MYCIRYLGLCERGYVKFHSGSTGKTIDVGNDFNGKRFATKFRFKWFADIICFLLNQNNDFRTYTVLKL